MALWQTYLYSRRDAVDDLDGSTVGVSRQRLADAVDLHLAFGLRAGLLAVDGFTGGTLQTAVLRRNTRVSVTRSHDLIVFLNSFKETRFGFSPTGFRFF